LKHLKVQKITLNKQTIANLDSKAQALVRGGVPLRTNDLSDCYCMTFDETNCDYCPSMMLPCDTLFC
jgi:hypothetical protein